MSFQVPLVSIDAHPSLSVGVVAAKFPQAISEIATPAAVRALAVVDAAAPLERSDELRKAVRDVLRHGGYKPTGRGKPAAEYLVKAATEGRFPEINVAVDILNVVSLHSGLPISVVDLELATAPFRVEIADPETSYVFNPGGQEIDISGLVCLFDEQGACANAVKDSQRTKTRPESTEMLSILWAPNSYAEQLERTLVWYGELLEAAGATVA